ncbi:MAG: FGGY-family carbohydrate kinase [Oscillospiraceae bacterium]|nr:FGGY-family carbohydrate kinase [Oscillospiraceae bacterium]
MGNEIYALAFDIGTTGVKTCLFKISDRIELISAASEGYKLYVMPGGGAEQEPDEWWAAMCSTSKTVIKKAKIDPAEIYGISFCSQMQGLVLVDKDGNAVRRAFSYMDQRATEELKKGIAYGPQIAGANIPKLLRSLQITGAVAASVKDPVWKYKWVEANEPENFAKVHKWLDVKEYLICRMTGEFIMTRDSAFSTMLYDIRNGKHCWSPEICKMLGVNTEHLAKIIDCTDKAGTLREKQAEELGLVPGIPVFGGGGDATLIGVGAGAVAKGDTHVYQGTSGWVSTVVDKSIVDANAMIAAIVGAEDGRYNYFAELETAGKCVEWVKDHLALDEIDVYLNKQHDFKHKKADMEVVYTNLYDYMMAVVDSIPAGSGGVIFTPWLHGNRCPFEDSNARGMFFNISLETGKTELIRAVVEGVCFHLRWMLEAQDKKVPTSKTIRFVGGGALSDVTSQILADCTGKVVETVESPQNVGSVGAAVLIAVSAGLISDINDAKRLIPASKTFTPNMKNKSVYDKNYAVFKELYRSNKNNFELLNKLK